MTEGKRRLRLLAVSFVSVCAPCIALAQTDATPETSHPASGTLVAQTQSQQFVVYFSLGKATLDDTARATIATAAQQYRSSGSARISVRGHTDTSGNASYNQALSERRERAVSDELVRLGVPADAITGEAVGETQLAVPTGDGVTEAQNRRVEIAVEQPPPPPAPAPAPEAAPAPEPVPPAAAAPEPAPEPKRGLFSVGPFYGYNLKDTGGGESQLAGLNFSFDYAIAPPFAVGLEQAVFYHFDTDDDGFGGRTAASLNFVMGNEQVAPYLGGNIGYLYASGIDDDFFAGPEVGIAAGAFNAKVAYDIPFNQDWDEGIIAATVGYGIRF
jgi:outer membrane protein OmpA-like peptidoglycan-associated protein